MSPSKVLPVLTVSSCGRGLFTDHPFGHDINQGNDMSRQTLAHHKPSFLSKHRAEAHTILLWIMFLFDWHARLQRTEPADADLLNAGQNVSQECAQAGDCRRDE